MNQPRFPDSSGNCSCFSLPRIGVPDYLVNLSQLRLVRTLLSESEVLRGQVRRVALCAVANLSWPAKQSPPGIEFTAGNSLFTLPLSPSFLFSLLIAERILQLRYLSPLRRTSDPSQYPWRYGDLRGRTREPEIRESVKHGGALRVRYESHSIAFTDSMLDWNLHRSVSPGLCVSMNVRARLKEP